MPYEVSTPVFEGPFDLLLQSLKDFDHQLAADPDLARRFIGHFHEGIYISNQPGWGGAHDLSHIRHPNWDEGAFDGSEP